MTKTPHQKTKAALKRLVITAAVFLGLLVLMIIMRQFYTVAMFLNNTVSRSFAFIMGNASNMLPFSVFEVFVYLAIIFVLSYLTLTIVRLIRKKRLKALHSFLSILLAVLVCLTTFFMAAGFSYAQTTSPVPIFDGDISLTDFERITTHFLNDFNYLAQALDRDEHGNVIQPYTDRALSDKLNAEFNRASLPGVFNHNVNVSIFRSGRLMSEMGIAGVFFPPLSEANINALLPASSRSFVMAHEIAHARGIMREDFANDVAWYITLNSESNFIRYSGYMSAFSALIIGFEQFGEYALMDEFRNEMHPYILAERLNNRYHWSQFNMLNNFTNWINDLFLRIMGQEDGTGAYTPDFDFIEQPKRDEETGEIIYNPITNRPEITRTPIFNTLQRVFFHIYM